MLQPGGTCVTFGASEAAQATVESRDFFATGGVRLYGLTLRYWNRARQRYCRRLTRYRNTLRVSADLAATNPRRPSMGFAPENQVRTGLPAGGRRIRTLGPPLKKDPPRRDVRPLQHFLAERDRGFESVFLHRRVGCERALHDDRRKRPGFRRECEPGRDQRTGRAATSRLALAAFL